MGLTVRLQSDPQSLTAFLQSGFIMITVSVSRFMHYKKQRAADLTKQTQSMAGLTESKRRQLPSSRCLESE